MADCPLADDCPSYSARISGMGCQHYGDRGGKEWCQHYNQPIDDLKTQPVKSGEEVVIDVVDMHESGAGVGRTEDGFIVMVDGVLPEARARVEITRVHSNHARAKELELLPMDEGEGEDEDDTSDAETETDADADADDGNSDDGDADAETDGETSNGRSSRRERLGSRENFWGN
ncbi:TRAM domain-containing protein [Natrialba chahannaoensis JCM 10990]|uniref:TRAM domain-containing protein n=1 Tax=Natrialba chahannaoensis JCM 10990 TaxID=1227492 RepID=M0AU24_9EURY|nr:TRAM domain-containing protein [Natrialba chahannaoensis]ELZ01438.1 TRAM domain-containing protein [Natrialba chahannaoensis JCM 10990]